jgi:hypothetical protein
VRSRSVERALRVPLSTGMPALAEQLVLLLDLQDKQSVRVDGLDV